MSLSRILIISLCFITFTATAQITAPTIDMVSVEGGQFIMTGGVLTSVSTFKIGVTEVTQGQWRAVMGNNPSMNTNLNDDAPVNLVTWNDAIVYCNRLSLMAGLEPCYSVNGSTNPSSWPRQWQDVYIYGRDILVYNPRANGFRLPTEAEWEYAARGGNRTRNYQYAGSNDREQVGVYSTWPPAVAVVKTKAPNELGLYDMSGNIEEWVFDTDKNNQGYPGGENPVVTGGGNKILRGGGFNDTRRRITDRSSNNQKFKGWTGFRLAQSVVVSN